MNIIKIIVSGLLLSLSYCTLNAASLDWQHLSQPYGGPYGLGGVISDQSNTLYSFVDQNGIYKSTDNAQHWVLTDPTGLFTKDPHYFSELKYFNNSVFVADIMGSVYQYNSQNDTWSLALAAEAGKTGGETRLYVINNTLYVFHQSYNTSSSSIYKSPDGKRWGKLSNSVINNATSFTVSTNGSMYLLVAGHLYKSTDYGINWNMIGGPAIPTNAEYLYATNTNGVNGLYVVASDVESSLLRSVDEGRSWTQSMLYLGTPMIHQIGDKLYLATASPGAEVQISTDDGLTWQPYNLGIDGIPMINISSANGIAYVASQDNLFKQTPDNKWIESDVGINNALFDHLINYPDGTLLGTTNNSVYRSIDDGDTWQPSNTGLMMALSSATDLSAGPTTTYMIWASGLDDHLYTSIDQGASWKLTTPLFDLYPIKTVYADNNLYVVGLEAINYYLCVLMPDDQQCAQLPVQIDAMSINKGNVYALNRDQTISKIITIDPYVSVDLTGDLASKAPGYYLLQINVTTNGTQEHAYVATSKGLFLATYDSSDLHPNISWQNISPKVGSTSLSDISQILVVNDNQIYAASTSQGIFVSIDQGKSWEALGLKNTKVGILLINHNNLFAATNKGTYRAAL